MVKNTISRLAILCLFLGFLLLGCSNSSNNILTQQNQRTKTASVASQNTGSTEILKTTSTLENKNISLVFLNKMDTRIIKFFNQQFSLLNSFDSLSGELFLAKDKCEIITLEICDQGFIITNQDFLGNIMQQKRSLDRRNPEDIIFDQTISPSGEWIAYKVITGEWGMSYADAPIQNVRLVKINIDLPQNAITITNYGGARSGKLVWSPNDQYLAFTDYDELNIQQLFVYNLQKGEKNQITNFTKDDSNQTIDLIKWAVDSSHIAFSTIRTVNQIHNETEVFYGIYEISLQDRIVELINVQDPFGYEFTFWWGDMNQLLLTFFSKSSHEEIPKLNFVWYDPINNLIDKKITGYEIGITEQIWAGFPLSSDLSEIILIGPSIYIFNVEKEIIQKNNYEPFGGFYAILETPSNNPFPEGCR